MILVDVVFFIHYEVYVLFLVYIENYVKNRPNSWMTTVSLHYHIPFSNGDFYQYIGY